jgi:hypothetical protein
MEASFTTIARGITHSNLNAELTLISAGWQVEIVVESFYGTREWNIAQPGQTMMHQLEQLLGSYVETSSLPQEDEIFNTIRREAIRL